MDAVQKKHFRVHKRQFNCHYFESLILAQDERWRRAYYMQVERVKLLDPFGVTVVDRAADGGGTRGQPACKTGITSGNRS